MTRSEIILTKLANAKKIKAFKAQGFSEEDAYKKAYPGPDKGKGVTDPAEAPGMPKEAWSWKDVGQGALDTAKLLPGVGALAQGAENAVNMAQGNKPSAIEHAGAIPGLGWGARVGNAALNKVQNANPAASSTALRGAAGKALGAAAAVPGSGLGAAGRLAGKRGVKQLLGAAREGRNVAAGGPPMQQAAKGALAQLAKVPGVGGIANLAGQGLSAMSDAAGQAGNFVKQNPGLSAAAAVPGLGMAAKATIAAKLLAKKTAKGLKKKGAAAWEQTQADQAAEAAHHAKTKRQDTTGGILPKQGYKDMNKDDKIDVRDAVAARAKLKAHRETYEGKSLEERKKVNQDALNKRSGGDNFNREGQLRKGASYGLSNIELLGKIAHNVRCPHTHGPGEGKPGKPQKVVPQWLKDKVGKPGGIPGTGGSKPDSGDKPGSDPKWKLQWGKGKPTGPGRDTRPWKDRDLRRKHAPAKHASFSERVPLEKAAWSYADVPSMAAKLKNAVWKKGQQAVEWSKQNPVAAAGVGTAVAAPALAVPAVGAAMGLNKIREWAHKKQKAQGAAAAALGGAAGAAAVKTVDPAVGGELPKQ